MAPVLRRRKNMPKLLIDHHVSLYLIILIKQNAAAEVPTVMATMEKIIDDQQVRV